MSGQSELSILRKVGILEGISALLLFFVAMPMKYIWGNESLMAISGNIHGFLFIAYIVMLIVVGLKFKWDLSIYIICIIGAILPFGAFYIDNKFFKPLSTK